MQTEHIIVMGYGDVGKNIIGILEKEKADFVVIDISEETFSKASFNYIVGNAADEEVLREAGIENASTVIITLNNDTSVIFATLIARGLNPLANIFARANSVDSIDKIYKAGADYVASLSIVAGQMLARITASCINVECEELKEEIHLYEGIEIEKYQIPENSALARKTPKELDLIRQMGCRVIGIQTGDNVIVKGFESHELLPGDIIAVAGTLESIGQFKQQYMHPVND
ncbi:Trk K+ transport system NAD-binding subunit [Methanohalophilus levihalophilus]|uniref:potassium channel family protein n=1 Tax=Methanohalophilus levihalophilus TaxID=1431282 RepID=UPI001AE77E0F|nr:NAD-binding protein [Methanohalophilus levihalophilus]MBP2029727.1 Trk K+ transport system NAD-binding subunit [Methanohalophilus levihalophilus]